MNINKKKVKVASTTYKIKYVKDISDIPRQDSLVCALCDFNDKIIYVALNNDDVKYSEEWLEETLIHELAHAFLYETGQDDVNDEHHAELLSKFVKFIENILG